MDGIATVMDFFFISYKTKYVIDIMQELIQNTGKPTLKETSVFTNYI